LTNLNNKGRIETTTSVLILMGCILLYGDVVGAQVLTNRTPDKAKIYPSPSPTPPTIQRDPLLSPPDPAFKRSKTQSELAYYVLFRNVSRVVVSDAHGTTDDIFQPAFEKKITSATYNFVGSHSVYIVLRINRTYSMTFESSESLMYLEVVKGRGNTSPEEAIRYRDLSLRGGQARLEITAEGIGPLRLDPDRDGRFETLLEPTISLRGSEARDTSGPELDFRILEGNSTSLLVSIEAKDIGSGVKSIFYSFDGQRAFPYRAPVRIDRKRISFIWVFAEDNAANRTASRYEF
jgi:hypothetical protein